MSELRDEIYDTLPFGTTIDSYTSVRIVDDLSKVVERALAEQREGIAAIRKLHRHEHAGSTWGGQCYHCGNGTWPCETIEAMGEGA